MDTFQCNTGLDLTLPVVENSSRRASDRVRFTFQKDHTGGEVGAGEVGGRGARRPERMVEAPPPQNQQEGG